MSETTKVDKLKFYAAITEIMASEEVLTAREIGVRLRSRYQLGMGDRQSAQPRITELCQQGRLYPVYKKFDYYTKKNVTAYCKYPLSKEAV